MSVKKSRKKKRVNIERSFRGIVKLSSQEINKWRKDIGINKKIFSEKEIIKQRLLEKRICKLGL